MTRRRASSSGTDCRFHWEEDREIGVTWLFANYYVPHPRYPWKTVPGSAFILDGTTLYQALSGIAHNRTWAFGLFAESTAGGPTAGSPGSVNQLVRASSLGTLLFTATAMATLSQALADLEAYCGK